MDDDFDNGMGLPEDELTGSTSMSDPGDLGLGGMDDDLDSEAPGRPSGGARARSSSASRQGKRPAAAPAAHKSAGQATKSASSAMKSASSGAKKKTATRGAKKKTPKKSARAASRKPMRKAAKAPGRKRKAGGKK
jgi:hypothetical protein